MPKEKSVNPAQAQRKAEKAKAIKKGKAEAQNRRNEKLAKRNPAHLEKELAELKSLETAGTLTSHEKSVLEGLERDLKAVKKAREALGDAAPKFGSGERRDRGERGERGGRGGMRGGRGGAGVLGKRRRDDGDSSEESDVPEDVKSIPMPRDSPPPVPKEVLDKWYQKRRERIAAQYPGSNAAGGGGGGGGGVGGGRGSNANNTPLGANERRIGNADGGEGGKERQSVVEEAKTVYEAKPVVRDLRKEATTFVPAAVRAKLDKAKGVGGLVEPEEADALERAGYMGKKATSEDATGTGGNEGYASQKGSRNVAMEEVDDEDG
ncbi:WW domain binding protein 11-domain-containing protein [Rhexocercosporidium sp. MPI-PUGE-AT-0058]|nr:WW domain binding protein 11-domain-containing protein [Rhexocercosporidium sp. MPI-PUGE-AT-0058]